MIQKLEAFARLRPWWFAGSVGAWTAFLFGCAGWQPQRLPAESSVQEVWHEPFNHLARARWREVEVQGRSEYVPVELDGRRCLRAQSEGGASMLLSRLEVDPRQHEWLAWEWRVDELLAEEALEHRRGSDASARVYVYFDTGGLPWQRRNIDYVWSAHLPVGMILDSAYSSASKIIVAESGREHLGQWRTVTRNLREDYQRCFGADPPLVLAIGLMTDSDNTQGETLAYFDELRISRERPSVVSQAARSPSTSLRIPRRGSRAESRDDPSTRAQVSLDKLGTPSTRGTVSTVEGLPVGTH